MQKSKIYFNYKVGQLEQLLAHLAIFSLLR